MALLEWSMDKVACEADAEGQGRIISHMAPKQYHPPTRARKPRCHSLRTLTPLHMQTDYLLFAVLVSGAVGVVGDGVRLRCGSDPL